MFDTMTITKSVGALAGALLIFLLGNWATEALYETGGEEGEELAVQGYLIEVEGAEEAEDEAAIEEVPDFAALLASADLAKGEKGFAKCKACHKVTEGDNATGPTLFNVVGRDIGSVEGYGYSSTLEGMDGNWTAEALNGFLESPKGYAPGTKMGFSGLKKESDRANLIAYLATIN